jgi:transcriptional regulator with XRE-family HTH domain
VRALPEVEIDARVVGKNINGVAASYGLNMSQFAAKIGVQRSVVYRWTSGRTVPGLKTLVLISEIFKVSMDELLEGAKTVRW